MSHTTRVRDHHDVATALAGVADRDLLALLDEAEPLGSGIGGTSALLRVGGVPVFVKRLPLTDLERRPGNVRSTANVFGLPAFVHYGVGLVGTPGFGAWRELAAHLETTEWVLAREHEGFPLLYHWRVLPHPGQRLPDELADVDKAVDYWCGDAAVRRRIEGVRDASASVALFLEYLPHNLHDWLKEQVHADGVSCARACAMVDEQLADIVAFLNSRGFLHLDAHFQNILTDGVRLYLGDFGLAVSSRFDLDADEAEFAAGHQGYDRDYSRTHFVRWLRAEYRDAAEVPGPVEAILGGYAPVADVMSDFYRRFQQESRLARYPGVPPAAVPPGE